MLEHVSIIKPLLISVALAIFSCVYDCQIVPWAFMTDLACHAKDTESSRENSLTSGIQRPMKQNRITEGCSKLKRFVDMTSS